jgi:hypothetical protein
MAQKYVILVQPKTAPSQEQIVFGIVFLSEKDQIFRGVKNAVNKNDAVPLGQVQQMINNLLEKYKDVVSNPIVNNSLSKDGNIVIFDGNTGKVIRDSGFKISDLEPAIEYTDDPNDYYGGDGNFYPLPSLGSFMLNQVVSGTQDGSNTTFTVPSVYVPGSLMLIRNGMFDFNITEDSYPSDEFEINSAPDSGESLIAIYKDPTALGVPEMNVSPSGTQDGVNTAFTTPSDFEPGTLMLIRNGAFDFEIVEGTSPNFTITNPPDSSAILKLIYIKKL